MLILETVKCTANIWMDILYLVIGLIVGVLAGFFISKKLVSKQLKENPPVNEEMIKTLMRGMGRNPSQKQVNQLMKQMQKFQ
ncbi:MAG: YneF family protein [Bacilli bacterium]|nr:YneF family protein [Mollicutes bacterium]MDY6072357.1 YneF family protein [Bacilli bacterium]